MPNSIEYRMPDGRTFRNGRTETGCYTSWELSAADPGVLGDRVVDELRSRFGGRIVAGEAA